MPHYVIFKGELARDDGLTGQIPANDYPEKFACPDCGDHAVKQGKHHICQSCHGEFLIRIFPNVNIWGTYSYTVMRGRVVDEDEMPMPSRFMKYIGYVYHDWATRSKA